MNLNDCIQFETKGIPEFLNQGLKTQKGKQKPFLLIFPLKKGNYTPCLNG